jgi:hypothetical protein
MESFVKQIGNYKKINVDIMGVLDNLVPATSKKVS